MAAKVLHVAAPGLENAGETAIQFFSKLHPLLRTAKRRDWPYSGMEQSLFALFKTPSSSPLPVAALTWWQDTGARPSGTEYWLRADPVHLRVDRQGALMFDAPFLHLTQAEAHVLVRQLNHAHLEEGWRFEAPKSPERWYVRLARPLHLDAPSPAAMRGRRVQPHLFENNNNIMWDKRINEIQMILHASDVNAAREQSGRLSVNSLWFWGAGCLPAQTSVKAPWAQVWTNEPLGGGLARLHLRPHDALPDNAEILTANLVEGESLIILPESTDPETLYMLSQNWLRPLLCALEQKEISMLQLYAGQTVFQARISHWRKMWRYWV